MSGKRITLYTVDGGEFVMRTSLSVVPREVSARENYADVIITWGIVLFGIIVTFHLLSNIYFFLFALYIRHVSYMIIKGENAIHIQLSIVTFPSLSIN